MQNKAWNYEEYQKLARQTAAEGCVLLRNEEEALPLKSGETVAVFGRGAYYYYKSGLGSGGLVNTNYVVSILDALDADERIHIEESTRQVYEKWIQENPVDEGHGWGTVPWSQKEMPLSKETAALAKDADAALVIIGRTAGEDQDNKEEEESYLLSKVEEEMLRQVCSTFKRTIVLLNVGNIIDMSWVEKYQPSAVMYVWQGGQEGGNGVKDVLMGDVNPCGKLTDTIAKKLEYYLSDENFENETANIYEEDIYVGYRYFETFCKEKVQYPFGFGLSYTTFAVESSIAEVTDDSVRVKVNIMNAGSVSGKEVVQIYVKAPDGKLDKADRVLVGFIKTGELQPGESETMECFCKKRYYASYDDTGVTGNAYCWLLEEGRYEFYAGTDVRSAVCIGNYEQRFCVMEQLEETCAPMKNFSRYAKETNAQNENVLGRKKVPARKTKYAYRQEENLQEITEVEEQSYVLKDVAEKKINLDTFVAQLTNEELIGLFHGEGMCSVRVTPGTAGAFGGVTEALQKHGIPAVCCADGPSGIRMDSGAKAFSLPNGTLLGCTFNVELAEQLYQMLGREMVKNRVDNILGPGLNIHRHPLNGRNFEYISEDPFLTGKMGVAQLIGLHKEGVTGTMKHFCANNQEQYRCNVEAVVSERALREIYLLGFEMAVKEGNAKSIMTTYGPLNGIWTAGNYELCSMILREQWNFKGIVMTDWWGTANWENELPEKENRAPMVLAQNDIYMCSADSTVEIQNDNVLEELRKGRIRRADLQRNARNILAFVLETPAMQHKIDGIEGIVSEEEDMENAGLQEVNFYSMSEQEETIVIDGEIMELAENEIHFGIIFPKDGVYGMEIEASSELSELAQLPISFYMDNIYRSTLSFNGMNGQSDKKLVDLGMVMGKNHYMKLKRQGKGLDIKAIKLVKL